MKFISPQPATPNRGKSSAAARWFLLQVSPKTSRRRWIESARLRKLRPKLPQLAPKTFPETKCRSVSRLNEGRSVNASPAGSFGEFFAEKCFYNGDGAAPRLPLKSENMRILRSSDKPPDAAARTTSGGTLQNKSLHDAQPAAAALENHRTRKNRDRSKYVGWIIFDF